MNRKSTVNDGCILEFYNLDRCRLAACQWTVKKIADNEVEQSIQGILHKPFQQLFVMVALEEPLI